MNPPAVVSRSGRLNLVTGAAGFIGSHLCDALLARGQAVVGVDCFTDYYARAAKENNLSAALADPVFRLVEADLVDTDLPRLLDGVAVIYHLAGQPGVRGSWGHQFEVYARNNILATQRLLEASRAAGAISAGLRLVLVGLRQPARDAAAESAAPAPVSPYGVTKLAAEHLCRLYASVYDLPTLSLRLFTVYGPRQRPDMAFQRFLSAAARVKRSSSTATASRREILPLLPTSYAPFLLAGEACLTGEAAGQMINVAGGTRASVNEVLAGISGLAGASSRMRRLPAQPGDVRDTWADTRLATSAGIPPEIGLAGRPGAPVAGPASPMTDRITAEPRRRHFLRAVRGFFGLASSPWS